MRIITVLVFLCVTIANQVIGQILEPVSWSTSVEQLEVQEYELIMKANIDAQWHLYAQKIPPNGPIATTFTFSENKEYTLIGSTKEEAGVTVYDSIFNMPIKYFSGETTFTQRIKTTHTITQLQASVEFMACNDKQCTPPKEVELLFDLTSGKTKQIATTHINTSQTDSAISTLEGAKGQSQSKAQVGFKKDLWTIFFIAFLSGFAALLTPCVFPMIPFTVSYFTKQSKNKAEGIRNAIFYGFSIIIIYVLLGSVVTSIFGADALNSLATNVWFNVFFFVLLVYFALSFLGAYEIVLPSTWGNQIDKQVDRKGIIGSFFMALTLAVVSFSCTGPIVGTLLVEAASKGGVAPMVGMFGFSLALALPFSLFAAFPGWLHSLPKSGGWLNTVKVFLGFLELALAFKFLSQADLVLQMHWLEREVFLAIWIAIFSVLAFYLFGKIRLPHDSETDHISVARLSVGLLVMAFTIYLIPGLWGAPLKLISAFPPPLDYSESPYGVGGKTSDTLEKEKDSSSKLALPLGAHLLAPHDIIAFGDYAKGMTYAQTVNKPILIDFTGWACVNCRKMEQNVWSDPKILAILKNEVVLISLYVDDKRLLAENEVVESKLRAGKKLKYVGQKWSELQTIRYQSNSQPFYVLINQQEEKLGEPVGYTPNKEEYYTWLRQGIDIFNQQKLQ